MWRTSFDVSHKIASSSRDFDGEKKIKKKISFSLLQDKIQHLTWHYLVAPFFFFSFTIVSFPLGFYIYLHSSSLCYSPSLHFSSSETSNLNLFSLCFSPPLLSVSPTMTIQRNLCRLCVLCFWNCFV